MVDHSEDNFLIGLFPSSKVAFVQCMYGNFHVVGMTRYILAEIRFVSRIRASF